MQRLKQAKDCLAKIKQDQGINDRAAATTQTHYYQNVASFNVRSRKDTAQIIRSRSLLDRQNYPRTLYSPRGGDDSAVYEEPSFLTIRDRLRLAHGEATVAKHKGPQGNSKYYK